MGGFLFLPILWFVLWIESAPMRVMWQFSAIWLIAYFTIRIFANIIMDRDAETERYWNNRKHFSRPSFRMWNDKDGLHIESGPNPDHATRCQNSLRDWYAIERRLKWNNWIYGGIILVLVLALEKL